MASMDPGDTIRALENAAEKHEHNLVIEFAMDRILYYVGVYLVAFFASLAKIIQLAAENITCYPAGGGNPSRHFIRYANSYCWESSRGTVNVTDHSCGVLPTTLAIIKDPDNLKLIFRVMPYVMLAEALLYALPNIYWHYRVGARVMGHLKFMKHLLNDIYLTVQKIPRGIYTRGKSYDESSYYLNPLNGYSPNPPGGGEKKKKSSQELDCRGRCSVSRNASETIRKDSLYRGMKDRHLFSMLCFENFSSMEHHPYIISVYHLLEKPESSPDDSFDDAKIKGMLRLHTNNKNFNGRFLIKEYLRRHIIGVIVSLIVVLATSWIMIWTIGFEDLHAESFRCDVMHHEDICMVCTFLRKFDMLGLMIINLVIGAIYLSMSIYQICFIRAGPERPICGYYEEISDVGFAALDEDVDMEDSPPVPEVPVRPLSKDLSSRSNSQSQPPTQPAPDNTAL